MLIKLIIAVVFASFAFACNGNASHSVTFREFASSIPILELPVEFNCSAGPEQVDYSRLDSIWLARLVAKGRDYLVGRIPSTEDYVLLAYRMVDDQNFPVLFTFRSDGSVIDSLNVVGDCFDAPDGTILRHSTRINGDRSVSIADTNRSYLSNSQGEIIQSSERVTVKTRHYSLSSSGRFVESNGK